MNLPERNPFSTRYTQPGALEYLFREDATADQLVAKLRAHDWFGQVIGPHGSGKTTLLKTLRPQLELAGRKIEWYTLRGGVRRLPPALAGNWAARNASTLIIVDGCEQVGRFARWQLQRRCRRAGVGLLVTCHRSIGLPTLWRVEPSLTVLFSLVDELLQDYPQVIVRSEVAEQFEACDGNVRETLFALYDLYELRRREGWQT